VTGPDCRARAPMLGSYLDGELEAASLIEMDQHVGVCEACREAVLLLRAMRGSLKQVIREAAPEGLRSRIENAMLAERARTSAVGVEGSFAGAPLGGFASWRTVVPVATAAALALVWGAAHRAAPVGPSREVKAGFADDLLQELVAEHSQPLPPEATNAEAVRGLGRWVGVPVRPASFERAGAHLVGGRVMSFRPERAAMMQFIVGVGDAARRVSVYVYDAQKMPESPANLAPRAVGTAEVRVGREKGYSVAATQREGVGYLLASDLDPDQTAQFAAMVYDDR
jgi:anti-sigma factor RsiW